MFGVERFYRFYGLFLHGRVSADDETVVQTAALNAPSGGSLCEENVR
jgi:hypothetical protein